MGSAGASSKPIQDIKLDLQGNPKIIADDEVISTSRTPLENPGTIEELHKKCKGKELLAN